MKKMLPEGTETTVDANFADGICRACPRIQEGEDLPATAKNATFYGCQIFDVLCPHFEFQSLGPGRGVGLCTETGDHLCTVWNKQFQSLGTEGILKVTDPERRRKFAVGIVFSPFH